MSLYSSKEWSKFYKEHPDHENESSFAHYCLPYIDGYFVDLGCGNGRDLYFFIDKGKHGMGVDSAFEDLFIMKQNVDTFIKQNKSPERVYTRFFWHSIPRKTQLNILKWVKSWLFIEARTTKDKKRFKTYKDHHRNYVDTKVLLDDLKTHGFTIVKHEEGTGLSPYGKEDPHLVRIVAIKT